MLRWLALAALAVIVAGCISAADAQQHDSSKDFGTLSAAGNIWPAGIWSDGTTMWVADYGDDKIYAYDMSTKARVASKDFDTLSAAGNTRPHGIWSDGTTMWVADNLDDKIYAYDMSTKARVASKDFDTLPTAGLTDPTGIWSDGTTMWVANNGDDKIYAYDMSTKARVASKDFDTLSAAGNTDPTGIWSDGTTMWVSDFVDNRIYAYDMSTKARVASKDFDTLSAAGNNQPFGIWSDRTITWVADFGSNRIYAYTMPSAGDTGGTSSGLSLIFSLPPPPPRDTTPPTVVSVERTGNATTADRALTWNVTFSEPVVVSADAHTNHTSVSNVTIPDLGTVRDTMLVDVPGTVIGGSVSVDLHHPITSGLLIELVAPDCTTFVIHNQTTTFLYQLRQPRDLGDLAGVGAAGQWTIHVSDHAKYWNGTLYGWHLILESEGAAEGTRAKHTITQHVAGPGNHTLSLDMYDIRDRAGNRLVDADPAVNEPYQVVEAAVPACRME